jgi:hypothetical protein
MVGSIQRSSCSALATLGSQEAGVCTTQPRALVTRPICSWTSTCWKAVNPPPPGSLGMLMASKPSSATRRRWAAASSAGSSPPASSAVTSWGTSSSARVLAAAWIARSEAGR